MTSRIAKTFTRRSALAMGAAAALAVALPGAPAFALSEDAARAHVREAADAVLALAARPGEPESKAGPLSEILSKYAAMPLIARFVAGPTWREMSDSQQRTFESAFLRFLSVQYARRFADYSGQTLTVGSVKDEGKRGLRVSSSVTQPNGPPVTVEWLVSDRPGRTVIGDIVIEGVSLLVTQREEVGAMLSARNGDIDKLNADLAR